jgi:hypothetical protein
LFILCVTWMIRIVYSVCDLEERVALDTRLYAPRPRARPPGYLVEPGGKGAGSREGGRVAGWEVVVAVVAEEEEKGMGARRETRSWSRERTCGRS